MPKSDSAQLPAPPRPVLRGWFHAVAAVAAVVVTILLLRSTAAESSRVIAVLVFCLSTVLLYAVSATYHIGRWSPRVRRVLRSFDHANIFVMIAGTYTPFCVVLLADGIGPAILITLWSLAVIGMVLKLSWPGIPRMLSTGIYIAMGWIGLLAMPQLVSRLPAGGITLLIVGGVLYTVGGIVYALRKPNLLPRFFGFHELFHVLGIAAHVAFLITVWLWVLPYGLS